MRFEINNTFSFEVPDEKRRHVNELEPLLSKYFAVKSYSEDVEVCGIYIICVSEGFAPFFRVMRPAYHRDKTYANGLHFVKTFLFDIKLDFPAFSQSDKIGGYTIIGNTLLKYLEEMKYPVALRKNFDRERFNRDMEEFFQSLGCKLDI